MQIVVIASNKLLRDAFEFAVTIFTEFLADKAYGNLVEFKDVGHVKLYSLAL